nr:SapC family protein [Sphingomonas aerophila]
MAQWEVLSVGRHRGLRFDPAARVPRQFAQIVASEFAPAALDHPILFTKRADTGAFYAGALLSLVAGESPLAGTFRPADVEREGFFVDAERIVIDRAHPQFGAAEGEPLFDPEGSPSPSLRHVQRALARLDAGLATTDQLVQRLLQVGVIEPIDISLSFDSGEKLVLQDLYTVSLDALRDLSDQDALALLREGDLQLCYIQAQSVGHIRRMAQRRNDQLAAAPV